MFDPRPPPLSALKLPPYIWPPECNKGKWLSDLNSLPLKAFSSLMFKNKLKNLEQTAQKITNQCAIHQTHKANFQLHHLQTIHGEVRLRENGPRVSSSRSSGGHSINEKKWQQKLITIPDHWSNVKRGLGGKRPGRPWTWRVEPYKYPLLPYYPLSTRQYHGICSQTVPILFRNWPAYILGLMTKCLKIHCTRTAESGWLVWTLLYAPCFPDRSKEEGQLVNIWAFKK